MVDLFIYARLIFIPKNTIKGTTSTQILMFKLNKIQNYIMITAFTSIRARKVKTRNRNPHVRTRDEIGGASFHHFHLIICPRRCFIF